MKFSVIFGMMKNYKWRSFFAQYWIILTVVLLLPFSLYTYAVFQNSNEILHKETTNYSTQNLTKIQNTIDELFSSIDNYYLGLCADSDVNIFLSQKDVRENSVYENVNAINRNMHHYIRYSNAVQSIYLYSKLNGYVLSTDSFFNNNRFELFSDRSWHDIYSGGEQMIFNRNFAVRGLSYKYLTVCKEIYYQNQVDGLVVFNLNVEELNKICGFDKYSSYYLVDQAGNIVFSNDDDKVGQRISAYEDLDSGFQSASAALFVDAQSKDGSVITSIKTQSSPLTTILKTHSAYYEQQRNDNINNIMLMGMLIVLLCLVVAFLITTKFYSSIARIMVILQDPYSFYGKGEEEKKASDEVEFITKNIISVIHRNSEIESELMQRLTILKESQIMALQLQLNPHFLFNTLHLINSIAMATFKKETDITRTITLLSDLLRAALDTTEYLIPLETEIDYLTKYLEIQNIKYKNKFHVYWSIAEETKHLKVFKFSLQPIIENSIVHGIVPSGKQGDIYITSKIQGANLEITITDRGIGMDRGQLSRVKRKMNSAVLEKKESIGLSNTNQRIQLTFGDQYGCDIDADSNGTIVTMTMPMIDK